MKGYGYVTGDGIFDTITSLITSKAVKDAGSEALEGFAKSAGDKLGTKVVERAFKEKSSKQEPTKQQSTKKQSRDILKEIYGTSLFKGNGLKRL